jgi:hypothetical protein
MESFLISGLCRGLGGTGLKKNILSGTIIYLSGSDIKEHEEEESFSYLLIADG